MWHAAASPLIDRRFFVLEPLGRGGMGTVLRAFDAASRRLVAIKVLDRAAPVGPGHPLSEEFRIWASLRHPNIIRAFELGRAESGPIPKGTPYLVLEHFRGVPAHQAMTPGATQPREIEEFARAVLRALAHVHAAGWVHRDLKPGNVLVGATRRGPGRVRLTDFGLAREQGAKGRPGRVSGSLAYAAPEVFLGGPVDGRADLYALGILLALLVVGKLPHGGGDVDAVVRWHLSGAPFDPRNQAPTLPSRMGRLIRALTARPPAERPATAAEALEILGERTAAPVARPTRALAETLRRLRLDIDAARLGARRVATVPREAGSFERLAREARVSAQIHGLRFLHLRIGRLANRSNLEHLVPWPRPRGWEAARFDEGRRASVASQLARRLLEDAGRSATVVVVDPAARRDPLADRWVACLEAAADVRGARPERTGLLVIVREATISRSAPCSAASPGSAWRGSALRNPETA